ncbi:MAG: helix-turn-helix transcriptional regulator [Lachnospiraceae bacterium]|nr:helix-turn-helix transcriptional regulator [Lachnospiraceae bacterium]
MQVNMMGLRHRHFPPFNINRPNGSGDYLLVYTYTDARIILDGEDQLFPKNTLIIFPKGAPQIYYSLPDGYVNDYIHFSLAEGEAIDCPPYNLPLNRMIAFPAEQKVDMLMHQIFFEDISTSQHKKLTTDYLLKALLLCISDIISVINQETHIAGYYSELQDLRSEIYSNPSDEWSVPKLAQRVGLSVSYFQKLYHDMFGISCYNDVILSKINYAKTQLASTNYSIRTIAANCGYDNDVHFMRQFKQCIGETPTAFRKRLFQIENNEENEVINE